MPFEPLTVKQSDLNKLMQMIADMQAGVFRSTSLFRTEPKTRQMIIEPLMQEDTNILLPEVKRIFTEERVFIEKTWRRIRINLDGVTFSHGA